jgi:hypothetical protein
MRRRRRKRASELTSLIDVLFILLFASLVQARDSMEREDAALVVDAGLPGAGPGAALPDAALPDAGPPDAGPADAAPASAGDGGASPVADAHREHARRLSALVAGAVHGRDVFVVEVAATGYAVEIRHWHEGALVRRQAVQHRLVAVPADEPSEFPRYLGENQPWQRLCPLVLASLAQPQPDLGRALVVITVDAPLADLSLALRDGLVRDAALCLQDAGGIAILLDPANPIPWSELDGIE